MAKLHLKKKENPKLKYKKLSDGRLSLYLEYYFGYDKEFDPETDKFKIKHKRSKEFLELYIEEKPSTPIQRKEKNETLEIAYEVRQLKEDELKSKKLNVPNRNKGKINFLDYCNIFLANYPNKDIRIVRYCIKYLREFVKEPKGKDFILPADITCNFAVRFKNYLEEHLNGETPHNYFTKFKKMCRQAIKEGYPVDDDILEIKNKRNEGLKKAILSLDEIQTLASTECGNPELKRAFLFCLNTGLRFCDVNVLKWHNVNDKHIIIKAQQKTGVSVYIDLNDNAKQLLGKKGAFDENVFTLPSLSSCL